MSTHILTTNTSSSLYFYNLSEQYISGSYLAFKFEDELLNTTKLCHLVDTSTNSNYNLFEITLTTGSEDLLNGVINLNTGWHKLNILNTISGSINEIDSYGTILYDRVFVTGSEIIQNYIATNYATVYDNNVPHIVTIGSQYYCSTGSHNTLSGRQGGNLTESYHLSLYDYNRVISGSTIDTSSLVTTSSFNNFTSSYYIDSQSFDYRINNITIDTSSFIQANQTSSMSVLSSSYALTSSYSISTEAIKIWSYFIS